MPYRTMHWDLSFSLVLSDMLQNLGAFGVKGWYPLVLMEKCLTFEWSGIFFYRLTLKYCARKLCPRESMIILALLGRDWEDIIRRSFVRIDCYNKKIYGKTSRVLWWPNYFRIAIKVNYVAADFHKPCQRLCTFKDQLCKIYIHLTLILNYQCNSLELL